MDEIRRELAHHLLMLVRGGGEHTDVLCVLAALDAYIEAKLKEKNQ
jgi:hypothetical protein